MNEGVYFSSDFLRVEGLIIQGVVKILAKILGVVENHGFWTKFQW
jgi:hypothetical protein